MSQLRASIIAWFAPLHPEHRLLLRDQLMMSVLASRRSFIPMVAGIGGLALAAHQWHESRVVLAWAATTLVAVFVCFCTNGWILRRQEDLSALPRLALAHLGSTVLAMIPLAAMGPLFWVHGDAANHLFILLTLTIAAAVATTYSAPYPPAACLNIIFIATSGSLCFAEGPVSYKIMAGLSVAIVAILAGIGFSINETATAMLKLRTAERALIAQLRAANEAKSAFLANMSHELRTPLNAVIGFSDLIRSQALGPIGTADYLTFADDIHVSGEHLLSLINDILDLSKIDAGKLVLDESEVDLAIVIQEAQRIVALRAQQGGVQLINAMPLGFVVNADERALRQVALNVTMNAIKFTPPGGAVSASLTHSGGGAVIVIVTDTGCGIKPEDLELVFEPFGQARDQSLSRERGTGLGLPIARSLMRAHGGDATLVSELGVGTKVSLTLPRERVIDTGGRRAA